MTTIIAIGAALAFVRPPGQQIVTFYTNDAISIHAGDTVRIAGIIVGKVRDLSIEPNQVRVRASVDQAAFVGDQSQVEVRMLTVVGGYYVNVVSLGGSPLGSHSIPMERVRMPYSLIRTLTGATKITDRVATTPIKESIDQLQHGLTGANVNAVTELINAGNGITAALEKQRGQLSAILSFLDEYIQRVNDYRGKLEAMIRNVAILEESLTLYGKGFGGALKNLGDAVLAGRPFLVFYMNHRSDYLARVRGVLGEFQAIADRSGVVVRVLRRIHERTERALEAQNATRPPELLATDLCIPVEGSPC
jgi:virulence factor Mce-like protein